MRTINSPGIQITETDLSSYAQTVVGTNVFVAGFAPQGPIDQVNQITTISEFESTYGVPANAAEAYFYENCKQIIQSPGNLYCTRLPYGSGAGEGFAEQYSALLFPTATAVSVTYANLSTVRTQSIQIIGNEGLEGVNFNAGIATTTFVLSSISLKPLENLDTITLEETKPTKIDGVDAQILTISTVSIESVPVEGPIVVHVGLPRQITLNLEEYQQFANEEFDWDDHVANLGSNPQPQYQSYDNLLKDTGFIVLNTSKSTNNEKALGYYVSIVDNTNFGPDSDYDSIGAVVGLTANNSMAVDPEEVSRDVSYGQVEVPSTRFVLPLSSTHSDPTMSVSRAIESVSKYNFGVDYFNDSVVFNVHKITTSTYQPNLLNISLVETYIGSFDHDKKTLADSGGVQRSFYLQDLVNRDSSRVKLLINPAISRGVKWTSQQTSSPDPLVAIRVDDDAKKLFANGVYQPTFTTVNQKDVGNVAAKLEHALRLVESVENYTLDIIADAGLSTIHTNKTATGEYNDLKRLDTALTVFNPSSLPVTTWREVYEVLETFASSIRKDCMAIVDPLRQVFLRGSAKQSERRGETFTNTIYSPLKALYAASAAVESNYVSTYGNWGAVYSASLDRKIWIPLSGAVAAVYAKSDAVSQPWYAPAGFNRGSIQGIIDVACNPTQKQRDNLYTISVNPVVFFPGEGFVVYGQKTLQKKPTAFDRVNVRRLFLTLERETTSALKYFVFEPNTTITRTRLVNTITPLFEQAKRTQGVYEYLIVCDERNNTPDSIDRNELIVDIYIKPVKAAEFILVNFIATRTGQDFSELI